MSDPRQALRFDPSEGTVIRQPPGSGYGYWVGGMKASYDPDSGTFALFYRQRVPLERGRGGSCAVAVSTDGISFDTVWEASKEQLDSSSIEVGHPLRHDESEWRLYISYERAVQRTWRIDVMRGSELGKLDTQGRRTVLEPGHLGLAWIKDPWVIRTDDGGYDLYCAVPARQGPRVEGDRIWVKPDDATVLATSEDGLYFPSIEYVFEAAGDDTWHGHRGRLDSLFRFEDRWVGTYSGGRTMYDNYEEWCGLVESADRRRFTRVPTEGPWIRSPFGSVRYVYGLRVEDRTFFYYEYTRRDGSHDLRVSVVPTG